MAIDGLLWLPFLLTIDKRMRREESTKIATNALNKIIAASEAKQAAGEAAIAKVEELDSKAKVKSKPKTKTKTSAKNTSSKTTTKKK